MQQFVICKNDCPAYILPLGTSEETANKVLAEIELLEGKESNNGCVIYWRLRIVKHLQNKPKINIQKYKTSGKYYTEYEIDLLPDELSEDGTVARMYEVSDRVRQLEAEYLNQGGFVRVTVEDIGYPCLLHNL